MPPSQDTQNNSVYFKAVASYELLKTNLKSMD